MRIEFRKITPTASPFEVKSDAFISKGSFQRLSSGLVEVTFHLFAPGQIICDRCGCEYLHTIDEKCTLKVSDGAYEGEDLDVIECFDHYVDFDAIILSEIEAGRSDYHLCPKCIEEQKTGE